MFIVKPEDLPEHNNILDVNFENLIEKYKIFQDLQFICEKEKGIGISAVQVGLPIKLFLIKGDGTCPLIKNNEYACFVNCEYEPLDNSKNIVTIEGCLSLKNKDEKIRHFKVERHSSVRVHGYRFLFDKKLEFVKISDNLNFDQQGVVFQHEIDHQMGKDGLISKKGQEIFIW
jgi:peptide deformylase